MADRASVEKLFAWADQQLGRIDILVNAAGVNIKNRLMSNMEPPDWDRVLAINATGVYHCMYAVLPQMRERKDGLIVNISSISGKRAAAIGGVAYNASKFAVAALSTSVANEECPEQHPHHQHFPGRGRYADPGAPAAAGERRAAGQNAAARRRGRPGRGTGQTAAAGPRAGADHQADRGQEYVYRARPRPVPIR